MSRTTIKFHESNPPNERGAFLECFVNHRNEIYISISDNEVDSQWVCLDVSTAIKLSKTLRTEINKAKEVCDE